MEKTLHSLKDILCRHLEKEEAEAREKGIHSIELLKEIQITTDAVKNIEKIFMLKEGRTDDGYSHSGRWEAQMHGMYDKDSSYRHRDHMGRYSRDGGYSHDGYSHGDAKGEMINNLEHMMNMAGSEKEREAIRRCMNDMRNA